MNFIQLKIVSFFKKNLEIFLLVVLLIITIFITQLYNSNTKKIQRDYLEIIRNSYFKKSVNYFFSNLKPKFEDIEYKIKNGDTLVNILDSFSVDKKDIQEIVKLLKENGTQNLYQNKILKITLENNGNLTGVSNIIIPVSKSRKFQVYKDYEQNTFLKNEIITNLERRIILKEGTIKS